MKKHPFSKAKMGEVWAISLGEDEYGYVRVFYGSTLGLFPVISKGLIDEVGLLRSYPARWHFGLITPANDATVMLRVGEMPFTGEEDSWIPPQFVPPDIFHRHYQIWHQGLRRDATEAEVQGLQEQSFSTPESLQRHIQEHRAECSSVQGSLSAAPHPVSQTETSSADEPILLEIVFQNKDFPFEGRDEVEDPLAEALEESGAGEVTGGGGGPETCAIDVETTDVPRALKVIRKTLRKLGCPATTEIHQHLPERIVHRL